MVGFNNNVNITNSYRLKHSSMGKYIKIVGKKYILVHFLYRRWISITLPTFFGGENGLLTFLQKVCKSLPRPIFQQGWAQVERLKCSSLSKLHRLLRVERGLYFSYFSWVLAASVKQSCHDKLTQRNVCGIDRCRCKCNVDDHSLLHPSEYWYQRGSSYQT